MIEVRFKKKSEIFDVAITAVGGVVSVGTMLYGVVRLGLSETWPELVLNVFYIACLVMMGMYFFKYRITTMQFNYWCSVCVGVTILLRDILFAPPLSIYWIKLVCHTLSVLLLLMLTFFYARKEWKTYSKRNLWMICIIDMVIAVLCHYDIVHEPVSEYTNYLLTEIWIRPTITYGMVACFVSETEGKKYSAGYLPERRPLPREEPQWFRCLVVVAVCQQLRQFLHRQLYWQLLLLQRQQLWRGGSRLLFRSLNQRIWPPRGARASAQVEVNP